MVRLRKKWKEEDEKDGENNARPYSTYIELSLPTRQH